MKTRNTWAVVAAAIIGAVAVRTAAADQKNPTDKPLYDRLGGVGPISVVVDEFIERLSVDALLNANPAIDAARKRVPKSYLKFHVTTLVCQVTGGPCKYAGRGMKESHAHLAIGEGEWAQMAKVFKAVLDKYKVPAKEQDELFAIVGTTKKDIVTAASPLDAKKVAAHLEQHVRYPATKTELVAACHDLADFTAAEKQWFATRLPEGEYRSAKDVMKAIGLN